MAILLVAYDLNKEVKRPDIVAEVKLTDWARLSESSYAIDTQESESQVYQRFRKHIDTDDALYVIILKRPWDGYGPKDVADWLNQRLPQ